MTAFVYRYSGMLLAFWMGFIFLLCAMPGQYFPSANWMDLLSLDKGIHAGLFFVLCVFWFLWAFKRQQTNQRIILYTLVSILYGISLEYMQALWFSNRSFDYFDMLANTFGCCFALSIHKFLFRRFSLWANN
jgi:hypothetical protein